MWLLAESVTLEEYFQCPQCYSDLRISRYYRLVATILAMVGAVIGCILSGAGWWGFIILLPVFSLVLYGPISLLLIRFVRPHIRDGSPEDLTLFPR
jgi:hypothetical protein